jgi:hypothetical protein
MFTLQLVNKTKIITKETHDLSEIPRNNGKKLDKNAYSD